MDCDTNTLSMIVVVPKFQYFQLFVDHKDVVFRNAMDDVHILETPKSVRFGNATGSSNAADSTNAGGCSNAGVLDTI